jgi:hypothetical protein
MFVEVYIERFPFIIAEFPVFSRVFPFDGVLGCKGYFIGLLFQIQR